MKIKCNRCGKKAEYNPLLVSENLVSCKYCKKAIKPKQIPKRYRNYKEKVLRDLDEHERKASASLKNAEKKLNGGMDIVETEDSLQIARPWTSGAASPVLLLFIMYNLIFFCFYFSDNKIFHDITPYLVLVQFVTDLVLLYYVLAECFNKTCVLIEKGYLTVSVKPFSLKKSKQIALEDLAAIYSKETVKSGRNRDSSSVYAIHLFHVHAVTKTKADIKLIGDLSDQDQAVRVEKRLKAYLAKKGQAPRKKGLV